MASAPVSVTARYPADLLQEIDAAAGPGKRTEWLIAAARAALTPTPPTVAPRPNGSVGWGIAPPRSTQVSPILRDPKAGRL